MRIQTAQDFINTFHPGDVFWWIEWYRGDPIAVRESKLTMIRQGLSGPQVQHTYRDHERTEKGDHALGDLIGPLFGVFTSHAEAMEALRERRQQFKKDPELKKRLIEEARQNALLLG